MGEIDIEIEAGLACQLDAQRANTRPGVENEAPATGRHFQAGGIAAVAGILGPGAGNRSAHPPEPYFQAIGQRYLPRQPIALRVHRRTAPVNRGTVLTRTHTQLSVP